MSSAPTPRAGSAGGGRGSTTTARTRPFEDVWHLLVHGELPDAERAAAFAAETAALRRLPDEVRAALPAIAEASGRSGPLAGLRTALSLLGAAKGFRPVYDIDADEPPPYRPCSPHCTGWAADLILLSRVRICRTRRTTCTC